MMPDLKDSQDKWNMEEIQDKQQIKDVIHYLVKWVGWSSEYNFYKSASHLVGAPEAVVSFEHKLKHKWKKKNSVKLSHIILINQ
jgi:hypothetical protein